MTYSCSRCNRPLTPTAAVCKCGNIVLRITWQPKQRTVWDLMRARGSNVATKIGFGGSRGSAKTRLGRDLALLTAFTEPAVTIWIVMRNLSDILDTWINKYRTERPELMQYYRASSPPEFRFPEELGGSTIAFRYADSLKDTTELERGPEVFLMIVDQAEQFSEQELVQINTPNRWPRAGAGAAKTLYLFNPGGQGTSYLRRVFYLQQFGGTERPSDFTFVQAYGWDNWAWFEAECPELDFDSFYALDGEIPPCPTGVYDEQWLRTVRDKHRFKIFVTRTSEGRKMWGKPESIRMGDLFGRFDQFSGQYFAGVWDERKCVITSKQVDTLVRYWHRRWMSMDWGFGHHSAVYWFVTGTIKPSEAMAVLGIDTKWPIDIVIAYRELVVQGMAEHDLAREIVRMTPEGERSRISKFVAGSDVFIDERKVEHTIAELIESVVVPAGLPRLEGMQDKSGSRVINARMLYEGFRRTTSMRSDNPPQDHADTPMLLISAECPQVAKAIPTLTTDPDKPEDVKKLETIEDDVYDSLKGGFREYLEVNPTVPREVRAREVLESAGEDPNARAMAMRHFEAKERQGPSRVASRPRWRQ